MAEAVHPIEGSTSKTPYSVLFQCRIEMPYGHYSKKNAKTISWRGKHSAKRPFIRSTAKAVYIERYILSVLSGITSSLRPKKPLDGPLHGMFTVYSPSFIRKDGHLNLRGGDLENLIQGPLDALTKAEIIKDDSLFTRLEAFKRIGDEAIEIRIFSDPTFNAARIAKQKSRQPASKE